MHLLFLFAGFLLFAFFWVRNRDTSQPSPHPLTQILPSSTGGDIGNTPVLTFTDNDGQPVVELTIRELCSHTAIIGASGSGKTTAVNSPILENLMALGLPGVIFGVKPADDRQLVEKLARRTGRSLTIIDRSNDSHQLNFLEYLLNRPNAPGQVSDVVEVLFQLPTLLNRGLGGTTKGEAFWENSGRMLLTHCLNLIYCTGYPLTIDAITQLLTSIPPNEEALSNNTFIKKSLCAQLFLLAEADDQMGELTPDQQHNLKTAVQYFREEYFTIPDVTRGSIQATLKSVLFYLNDGTIKRLFCSETTFLPEECFVHGGRTVFIDLPPVHGQGNVFALGLFREVMKRAVISRDILKYNAYVYFYNDEYQAVALPTDADFFGLCRSQKVMNIIAFQTFDSLCDALGSGEGGKHKANIILGNCNIKYFLKSQYETAKYMADAIGREYKELINRSYGTSGNEGSNRSSTGQRSTNNSDSINQGVSTQTQRDHIIFPEELMQLANGGAANGYLVEAYLLPGKYTKNKTHFLQIRLAQDLKED